MESETRREFLKTAIKLTALTAAGMSVLTIDVKFNNNKGIATGKEQQMSVGMAEANAVCGSAYDCSGGGGKCGSAYDCSGGGGKCGSAYNCSGE